MQNLLDVGKYPLQQPVLLEQLAAVLAGPLLHVTLAASARLAAGMGTVSRSVT
jgi:hypothetical protein